MKKTVLLSLLLFFTMYSPLFARPFQFSKNEVSNPSLLLKLGSFYDEKGNRDKALYYYERSLKGFESTGDHSRMGLVHRMMARTYKKSSQMDMAIQHVQLALEALRSVPDYPGILDAQNLLAVFYSDMGMLDKSLEIYHQALIIAEKANDSMRMGIIYSNMAGIYSDRLDKEKGLEYNLKAFSILRGVNDDKAKGYVLNNIGTIYLEKKNYGLALNYFNQSFVFKKRANDLQGEVFTRNNIGDLYLKKGEISLAYPYFREALKLAMTINDPLSLCVTYSSMGNYYRQTGDERKALDMFFLSLELSRMIQYKWEELNSLREISTGYEKMKRYPEAIAYLKRFTDLKDTLFEEKSQKAITEMNARYDLSLKEKKIVQLQVENTLKNARIERIRMYVLILLTSILLILTAALTIIFMYRQKLAAYKELVKKDMEIVQTESDSEQVITRGNTILRTGNAQPLPDEMQEKIYAKLQSMMVTGKRFLDPQLTLFDLARELNTNTTYLSRIINDRYANNFSQFINDYRIREARKRLSDLTYSNLSIEGIARSVGFNSKSAFNAAFKQKTGVTPSFYQLSAKKIIVQERACSAVNMELEGSNYPKQG